jgi:DnaJ family protein A protein 2
MTDFYKTLDISKQATQSDIKIAYRKKALEHHPDKGGNADVFKDIQSAYDTLKDPVTRQNYDNPPPPQQNIFAGMNNMNGMADIFRQHSMGGFNMHNFFNQVHTNHNSKQPQIISSVVNLTLFDLYTGIEKNIPFEMNDECPSCSSVCNICNGQCIIQRIEQTPMGHRISMHECSNCKNGIMFNKSNCSTCNNSHYIKTNEVIPFKITPGIPDNHTVNIKFTKNNKQYVLNLTFKIDYFQYTRNNQDLILNLDIPLINTITGQNNKIILPDSSEKIINSLDFFEVIKHHKLYKTNFNAIPYCDSNNIISHYGVIYIKYNIINANINSDLIKTDKQKIIDFLNIYIS